MKRGQLEQWVAQAVRHFWTTREGQQSKQGQASGLRDAGSRGAVTGGAHIDGFIRLVARIVADAGLPEASVHHQIRNSTYLPGFYRPTKSWDLLLVDDGHLLACIEFKSQVGSFGNNFNNRTEEAIGSATDLWTAYREGAFEGSPRPWLGYFFLLEDSERSNRPVVVKEPHFRVFPEFQDASYARRYELLCRKLVRERMYDGTCFILSSREGGAQGSYREPDSELGFGAFAMSLRAHVIAYAEAKADAGRSKEPDDAGPTAGELADE